MDIRIIKKESFILIGKEGQGLADEGFKWVPAIWQETMPIISDIKALEKLDDNGDSMGIWGAMSDIDNTYNKWDKEGKYLVGIEAESHMEVPVGWIKWQIPSFEYIVVVSTDDTYGDTMKEILKEYMPKHKYSLVGAIQEYYSPKLNEGEMYLYFPIRRL